MYLPCSKVGEDAGRSSVVVHGWWSSSWYGVVHWLRCHWVRPGHTVLLADKLLAEGEREVFQYHVTIVIVFEHTSVTMKDTSIRRVRDHKDCPVPLAL